MRFEKSKTAKARSRQHKKRADQLVAAGFGSATVTFENGSTIFDHYKALQDFCVTMGKDPEHIDVHIMLIANLTEICKLEKGLYVGQFPDGKQLSEYAKVAENFG